METLRKITQNKIFKIVFALFLIIPFGLFGVEQYLSAPVGGDTVVNVGGAKIGRAELDQAIRQEAERYRAQFGANFDPAIMENPEIRRSILDRVASDLERLRGRLGGEDAQRLGAHLEAIREIELRIDNAPQPGGGMNNNASGAASAINFMPFERTAHARLPSC